jgi:hypothetical protein
MPNSVGGRKEIVWASGGITPESQELHNTSPTVLFNCVEQNATRTPRRRVKPAAGESGSNGGAICPKCIAGQLGDGNVTRLIIGPIETSESATAVWSSVR